jgi:hypothetical protein
MSTFETDQPILTIIYSSRQVEYTSQSLREQLKATPCPSPVRIDERFQH